jgi:hypothetical protein
MAAHKGPASLRPRCTRSGSSVAAISVYQSTVCCQEYERRRPLCFVTMFWYFMDGTEKCSRKVPGSIPGSVARDVFCGIRQLSTRILLDVKTAGACG